MELQYKQKITEDVQSREDFRNIAINKVGICDLELPLKIYGLENDKSLFQNVNAKLDLSVDLDHSKKGIHMSRLIETVLDNHCELAIDEFDDFLLDICERQGADSSYAEIKFNYFFTKEAPITGKASPQVYQCSLKGEYSKGSYTIYQGVGVPVKTLCPCSKEISDYGAHNQRSMIFINLKHPSSKNLKINIEQIIAIAESSASSALYPLLKREDERHVTMMAYDNPRFVEDVVRNVATRLNEDGRFEGYEIKAVNFESIHSHNAFAVINK